VHVTTLANQLVKRNLEARGGRKLMTEDVYEYFMQQYKAANFTVVPGHWPDFQSKIGTASKTLPAKINLQKTVDFS